jgi:hypothetical protein
MAGVQSCTSWVATWVSWYCCSARLTSPSITDASTTEPATSRPPEYASKDATNLAAYLTPDLRTLLPPEQPTKGATDLRGHCWGKCAHGCGHRGNEEVQEPWDEFKRLIDPGVLLLGLCGPLCGPAS